MNFFSIITFRKGCNQTECWFFNDKSINYYPFLLTFSEIIHIPLERLMELKNVEKVVNMRKRSNESLSTASKTLNKQCL